MYAGPSKSPASARKVSDGETLRALAEADASTSALPPQTPQGSRRRSIRTPRQVQQLLSARKVSASGRKSRTREEKEQTPGQLLRALSRTYDFPPATPDDEPAPNADAGYDKRRRSIVSRPSIGGAPNLGELAEESEFSGSDQGSLVDYEGEEDDDAAPADPNTPRASTSLLSGTPAARSHSSPRDAPSSDQQVAATLGVTPRSSRPFPPQPNFNPVQSTSTSAPRPAHPLSFAPDDDTFGYDAEEKEDLRRYSVVSARSVEFGRRASRATSAGSPDLVSRRGDEGEEDEEEGGESMRRISGLSAFSGGGRPSMAGSEGDISRDLSNKSRISSASGFGSPGAANLSLVAGDGDGEPFDDEDVGTLDLRESSPEILSRSQRMEQAGHQGGSEDGAADDVQDPFFDFGGGGPEEEEVEEEEEEEDVQTGRIPWKAKGKNRVVDEEHDEPIQYDDDDEPEPGSRKMPQPPALTKTAAARKKRTSLKTQRYTPDGRPVADLPRSRVKTLFQHFLGPNVKLENDALDAVMDASQEFFATMMEDASAYAQHAGRKKMVNESDLVTMMLRQRVLTDKCGLQTLGRRMGLDRELQSIVDSLGPDGKRAAGVRKGKKRKAVGRGVGRAAKRQVMGAKKPGKGKEKAAGSSEEASGGEGEGGSSEGEEDYK